MSLQGLTLAFWWQQKEESSAFGSAEEQGPGLLWEGATETRARYRYRPVCMAPVCPETITTTSMGLGKVYILCLWDYTGKQGNTNSPWGGPIAPKAMANGTNGSYCEIKESSEQEILRPQSDMQSICRFKKPFFERIKPPPPHLINK